MVVTYSGPPSFTTSTSETEALIVEATEDSYVVTDLADEADPQGFRRQNYGDLGFLKTWYAWGVVEDERLLSVDLVKFDLEEIQGLDIESVSFQLFASQADLNQTARLVDVHTVTGEWAEAEVTYDLKPPWDTVPIATAAIYGAGGWYTWNVTGSTLEAIRRGEISFAVALRSASQGNEEQVLFVSTEAPDKAPRLLVTYRPATLELRGYDLSSLLPSVADLPGGVTLESEGCISDTEYERTFVAVDETFNLGSSRVSVIGTKVELYPSAAAAENLVSLVNTVDPSTLGDTLAADFTEDDFPGVTGTLADIRFESLDPPAIGAASGGWLLKITTAEGQFEGVWIFFSQSSVGGVITATGAEGQVSLEDMLPLAELMADRIRENFATHESAACQFDDREERAYERDLQLIQTAVDSFFTAADNVRYLGLRQFPILAADATGTSTVWDPAAADSDLFPLPANPVRGTQGGEPKWRDDSSRDGRALDANGMLLDRAVARSEENLNAEAVTLANNGVGWSVDKVTSQGQDHRVDTRGYFINFNKLVEAGILQKVRESASPDNGGGTVNGSYSWYVRADGSVDSLFYYSPSNGIGLEGSSDGTPDFRGYFDGVYP